VHKVNLEDDIVEVALERRGNIRLFDSIDPKATGTTG
jgi:hypothetical protein